MKNKLYRKPSIVKISNVPESVTEQAQSETKSYRLLLKSVNVTRSFLRNVNIKNAITGQPIQPIQDRAGESIYIYECESVLNGESNRSDVPSSLLNNKALHIILDICFYHLTWIPISIRALSERYKTVTIYQVWRLFFR